MGNSVVDLGGGHFLIAHEQRDRTTSAQSARRFGCELHAHLYLAGRERAGRLLPVDLHAKHAVRVLQLPVLDEQREPTQVIGLRHDHPLGATFGNDQVGGDAVGVGVDGRDHARSHAVDVAREPVCRLRRRRGHDAPERAQRGE